MNTHELKTKVTSAMYKLIKTAGFASPIDVLMEIGVLSKENYEKWRDGKVAYLERVCVTNLHKLTTVRNEIKAYARKHRLKASWTMYKKWKSKGRVIPLRFSKYGLEHIEREYATHYISATKVLEAQERRKIQHDKNEQDNNITP